MGEPASSFIRPGCPIDIQDKPIKGHLLLLVKWLYDDDEVATFPEAKGLMCFSSSSSPSTQLRFRFTAERSRRML